LQWLVKTYTPPNQIPGYATDEDALLLSWGLTPLACLAKSPVTLVAGLTYDVMAEKFPMWNDKNIREVRMQFQTFDVKQDGLIDFHEL